TSSSFACPDTSACVVITNLGITDQEEDKWVVYPNPVNDRLFIDANVAISSVHLTALNGQQIQVEMNADNSIDVRELAPGVYFVNLSTEEGVLRKRIIKH